MSGSTKSSSQAHPGLIQLGSLLLTVTMSFVRQEGHIVVLVQLLLTLLPPIPVSAAQRVWPQRSGKLSRRAAGNSSAWHARSWNRGGTGCDTEGCTCLGWSWGLAGWRPSVRDPLSMLRVLGLFLAPISSSLAPSCPRKLDLPADRKHDLLLNQAASLSAHSPAHACARTAILFVKAAGP